MPGYNQKHTKIFITSSHLGDHYYYILNELSLHSMDPVTCMYSHCMYACIHYITK